MANRWDNRAIMHISESEKDEKMHRRFVSKENVKKLKAQGYEKCDSKNSNISEPKRGEMVIMQISKKDAEEKREYFRGLHQEKVEMDKDKQKEMSKTVFTPQGRRPVR